MTSGGRYKPRRIIKCTCRVCGHTFDATRPDAMYCDTTCRQEASRAKRAGKGYKRNVTCVKGVKK